MGKMYLIFLINQRLFFFCTWSGRAIKIHHKFFIKKSSCLTICRDFRVGLTLWTGENQDIQSSVLCFAQLWLLDGSWHSKPSRDAALWVQPRAHPHLRGTAWFQLLQPSLPWAFSRAQGVESYFWQERKKSSAIVGLYFCCNSHIWEEQAKCLFFLLNTAGLFPVHRWLCSCSCSWGCDPKLSYCTPCFGSSQLLYSLCAHLWHS